MAALSKQWQLINMRSLLRILANELAPDKLLDAVLTDFIYLALCDVVQLLGESALPDYGEIVSLPFTTRTDGGPSVTVDVGGTTPDITVPQCYEADISTLDIDKIILIRNTERRMIEREPKAFENLHTIPQMDGEIYFYQYGDKIFAFVGKKLCNESTAETYMKSFKLHYTRNPIKAVSDTDYLDIRDTYAKLVLDKAKVIVYEELRQAAPDSLTASIDSRIQMIRQANIDELTAINGGKQRQ